MQRQMKSSSRWGSGELPEECRDGVNQITFGLQWFFRERWTNVSLKQKAGTPGLRQRFLDRAEAMGWTEVSGGKPHRTGTTMHGVGKVCQVPEVWRLHQVLHPSLLPPYPPLVSLVMTTQLVQASKKGDPLQEPSGSRINSLFSATMCKAM